MRNPTGRRRIPSLPYGLLDVWRDASREQASDASPPTHHMRVRESDGSEWVNAEAYDQIVAALRGALPGLESLVAQACPEPDVAAWDIEMRDTVKAALAAADAATTEF